MHLKILYIVNKCISLFFSTTMSQASLRLKHAFLRAENAAGFGLAMPYFGHAGMPNVGMNDEVLLILRRNSVTSC